MEINKIIRLIIRKWWLIVFLLASGGGLGFASAHFSLPFYEVSTSLYIMPSEQHPDNSMNINDFTLSKYLVEQYSDIISSKSVASAILKDVQEYEINEYQLMSMVRIVTYDDSSIFYIKARGTDPELTAAVANATARQFRVQLNRITKSSNVQILDVAVVPQNPVSNNSVAKIMIGLLLGLVCAVAIIYAIEYFDNKIRSAEDVEDSLKLHVIGFIPEHDIR